MSVEQQPLGEIEAQTSVARNRELFKAAWTTYNNLAARNPDIDFGRVFDKVREIGENATVLRFVGLVAEGQIQEEQLARQKLNGSNGQIPLRLAYQYASPLTKVAESGFQLPEIEEVSKPNFKQRPSEPIGKEVVLFSIDRGF